MLAIGRTLSEFSPFGKSLFHFMAALLLIINRNLQLKDRESITGLQEDLTAKLLYSDET